MQGRTANVLALTGQETLKLSAHFAQSLDEACHVVKYACNSQQRGHQVDSFQLS